MWRTLARRRLRDSFERRPAGRAQARGAFVAGRHGAGRVCGGRVIGVMKPGRRPAVVTPTGDERRRRRLHKGARVGLAPRIDRVNEDGPQD